MRETIKKDWLEKATKAFGVKRLKRFAEKLSKCKSYAQAVENSGLSESQIKTVRGKFRKIGISPITLRNNAKMEKLHFPCIKG